MNKLKKILFLVVLCLSANIIFAQKTIEDAKKLTISEQYALAEEAYKVLIKSNATSGDNYYYYGDNEIKAFFSDTITRSLVETYEKCKSVFETGVKNDAANQLNLIGLARIEYIIGNTITVNEYITKINATLPLPETKIKKIPDPKRYALLLTEMAKVYIVAEKTDTASALPLLRRAKLADPTNSDICITMGDAYLNVKDVNKAIESYNAAQTLDPASPIAKFKIGYMYFRAKNLSEAIKYFEESLKIDANFAPTYKELGFLYSMAGKLEDSKANYLKYLEISGNNVPAKISYVVELFKSGFYKDCIAQIEEIFAIDSTINSMNRVIAYCYYEDKQYTNAQYYIEKFFANTTPDKIINKDYVYYGKIMGENKNADLAEVQFRKALELDGTQTELYTEIAKYQKTAKNYVKAANAYEEKIAIGAATIEDYYNLGKIYYSDAKFELSDLTFDKVLAMEFGKYKNYKILCYYWQGFARVSIDTTFATGYAKPVYDKLIEEAKLDSAKNFKYLVEGYSYYGYYYLVNEENKDYCKSKSYYNQVLAIDPNNEKAPLALSTFELTSAKCPEDEN
jgi:tetratricopeptide (TPR) repeat protein